MRAGVRSGGGAALPGMIFNAGKRVTYTDALTGAERTVHAGRMECTMQARALCSAPWMPLCSCRHCQCRTFTHIRCDLSAACCVFA